MRIMNVTFFQKILTDLIQRPKELFLVLGIASLLCFGG